MTAPLVYPPAPHQRRHGPRGYAHYSGYRPWLRDEFCFRCTYCLLREQWTRHSIFGVDHFLAVAHHPAKATDYDNLLYACVTCNAAKGDRVLPDPTTVLTSSAVRVLEDGTIRADTAEAARLIELLGLDSPQSSEFRMLWIGIIALATRHDTALYRKLMGFRTTYPTSTGCGRRAATRGRKGLRSLGSQGSDKERYLRRIEPCSRAVPGLPGKSRVSLAPFRWQGIAAFMEERMQRKLILFELNEVPYRIVEEFVGWRPNSCLASLLQRCQQFETYAEDRGHLSPWVTWPTLHRGVADDRHGITSFGQDLSELNRQYPPVWSILARQGISTGVFGSLHSYPPPDDLENDGPENYAFYVPDTFAAGSECFPKKLSPFQEFNLAMAGASGRNVDRRVHWRGALRMLASLPDLGLRADTMLRMGGQLVAERLQPWRRTRRRTCQVVLAFDIFLKQLRRTQPSFATFFTNHVASSMHRYWAAAFPKDYDEFHVTDEWVRTYRNEIDFTMCCFDRFLGRLARFVERQPEYRLLVASSMGQAATIARHFETQLYITDLPKFMAALGVSQADWSRRPAMAPDTSVVVAEHQAAAFQATLAELRIDGKPVHYVPHEHGFFHIRLGQADAAERIRDIVLHGERRPMADLGLAHVKIDDRAGCTAYHIPQGMLLLYDPRTAVEAPRHQTPPRVRISTLDVAPLILNYFDVRRPEYMARPALRAA